MRFSWLVDRLPFPLLTLLKMEQGAMSLYAWPIGAAMAVVGIVILTQRGSFINILSPSVSITRICGGRAHDARMSADAGQFFVVLSIRLGSVTISRFVRSRL